MGTAIGPGDSVVTTKEISKASAGSLGHNNVRFRKASQGARGLSKEIQKRVGVTTWIFKAAIRNAAFFKIRNSLYQIPPRTKFVSDIITNQKHNGGLCSGSARHLEDQKYSSCMHVSYRLRFFPFLGR